MEVEPRQPRMEVIPPGEASAREALAPRRPAAGSRSVFKSLLSRVPGVTTVYGLALYLMDDEAPDLHRFLILLTAIYAISPIDIIPDFIPMFLGLADDGAALFFLLKFIGSEKLAPYREQARRILRGEIEA